MSSSSFPLVTVLADLRDQGSFGSSPILSRVSIDLLSKIFSASLLSTQLAIFMSSLKHALREPSRQNGSKCRIFFILQKVIFRVLLITCQKVMSLRSREPPSRNLGYACIIDKHRFTLSNLWGRFFQFFFSKSGLLKRMELSQFLCYWNDSHIKT